jgi:hypothetical protein
MSRSEDERVQLVKGGVAYNRSRHDEFRPDITQARLNKGRCWGVQNNGVGKACNSTI